MDRNLVCSIGYLNVGGRGGAMVRGNLPVPGRLTIWMIVRQGPVTPSFKDIGPKIGHWHCLTEYVEIC